MTLMDISKINLKIEEQMHRFMSMKYVSIHLLFKKRIQNNSLYNRDNYDESGRGRHR